MFCKICKSRVSVRENDHTQDSSNASSATLPQSQKCTVHELSMKHHVTKMATACHSNISSRFGNMSAKNSAGACIGNFKTFTIAMQLWPVCHWRLSHLYNEFRTLLPSCLVALEAWSIVLIVQPLQNDSFI